MGVRDPLRQVVDLSVGETAEVRLCSGEIVPVQLLALDAAADELRHAVREARVKVRIRDQEVWLSSANYHLPTPVAGVQVDCPITGSYYTDTRRGPWALDKDARLRLWPAGSPWIEPDAFLYPARQRWFASNTQMANEPTFVDTSPDLHRAPVYYHDQLDIGGVEGMVEVVAATDGVVIMSGDEAREDIADFPCQPRSDYVAILDDRRWVHLYAHLHSISRAMTVGARVAKGTRVGILGKEGGSGGWAHLHYGIQAKQPSGRWGTEEGYACLWQAYLREYRPALVAVARPHHLLVPGRATILDGSLSWAQDGPIRTYEWTFSDGSKATGARVERAYEKPGVYSEILKVADGHGNVDYDFAVVDVFDAQTETMPPGIHAAYSPTFGIKPGDAVTFAVRCFGTTDGSATWDFGDCSPSVSVRSNPVRPNWSGSLAPDGYALTVHRYAQPGRYLVSVRHVEDTGIEATARIQVRVGVEGVTSAARDAHLSTSCSSQCAR